MKIVKSKELKEATLKGPFYDILDEQRLNEKDPRYCGCASLSLLNAILFLKEKYLVDDGLTPFDELIKIKAITKENGTSITPENFLNYLEKTDYFYTCHTLVVNPNAMVPKVFLNIFLKRIQKSFAFILMEIPRNGSSVASNDANHVSFIHYLNGEIYFDGLRVNLDFLLKIFYFSKTTTLMFFTPR
jgi:hypothetical protein